MNKRNISFEALRVIFILYMVLHHLDTFNGIEIPSFSENIKKFCFEGFVGVNFFFMLSGLGCVLGYKDRLDENKISSAGFLYNRFAKLYPAYFLFLILSVFLYNGGHFGKMKLFLMHTFMLQTFPLTSNQAFGYNGVAWCVFASFFFYLIFIAIHKINFKECLSYIAFLSVFIAVNILFHSEDGYVMTALFYTNPIFRLLDFLIGMAIGLYFKNHLPIHSCKMQIASILVFLSFLFVGAYSNISWLYKWSIYYLFPCAFLLVSFYGETRLSKTLFGHQFWLSLSSASMVIFLSHQQFLNLIKLHLPEPYCSYFYKNFMPWGILLSLFFIVVLSLVINKYFETPIYSLLIKLKNRRDAKGKIS